MFLLNGTLINEAVFSYERLDLQLSVCTQQASLSRKNALVQFLQFIARLAVTQKKYKQASYFASSTQYHLSKEDCKDLSHL